MINKQLQPQYKFKGRGRIKYGRLWTQQITNVWHKIFRSNKQKYAWKYTWHCTTTHQSKYTFVWLQKYFLK